MFGKKKEKANIGKQEDNSGFTCVTNNSPPISKEQEVFAGSSPSQDTQE